VTRRPLLHLRHPGRHHPRVRMAARPMSPHPRRARAAAAALLLLVVYAAAARAAPPAYGASFDARWRDGRAELASYDLTYPRYGEDRTGTAVTVIVTEPFNADRQVKSDSGGPGSFGVLKLNLAEDFPTGVYDYNLMTSVFVATEQAGPRGLLGPGDPVKVSFSSQEWCGQTWQQAGFRHSRDPSKVHIDIRSYFESEGDLVTALPHPDGGFAEDALILWARGLAGPQPRAGESVTVPLYRSAAIQRLRHTPAAWDSATLTRDSTARATAEIRSDVGDRSYVFTLDGDGMLTRLKRSDGYTLDLRGVERVPYWSQSGNDDQKQLGRFGLEPRGPGRM